MNNECAPRSSRTARGPQNQTTDPNVGSQFYHGIVRGGRLRVGVLPYFFSSTSHLFLIRLVLSPIFPE